MGHAAGGGPAGHAARGRFMADRRQHAGGGHEAGAGTGRAARGRALRDGGGLHDVHAAQGAQAHGQRGIRGHALRSARRGPLPHRPAAREAHRRARRIVRHAGRYGERLGHRQDPLQRRDPVRRRPRRDQPPLRIELQQLSPLVPFVRAMPLPVRDEQVAVVQLLEARVEERRHVGGQVGRRAEALLHVAGSVEQHHHGAVAGGHQRRAVGVPFGLPCVLELGHGEAAPFHQVLRRFEDVVVGAQQVRALRRRAHQADVVAVAARGADDVPFAVQGQHVDAARAVQVPARDERMAVRAAVHGRDVGPARAGAKHAARFDVQLEEAAVEADQHATCVEPLQVARER
ncbi:conserved hypothetical protein, partial [Ricinus communis]